jgi:hypothetical protein
VLEARKGRYEVYYRIDAATAVHFTGSTETAVLDAAASWLGEQLKRKDRGVLGPAPPPKPTPTTKRKPKNVVEA